LTILLVLEGANPSAEGEDADDGGDDGGNNAPVLDLAQSFRWQKIEGVSKKAYQSDLKSTYTISFAQIFCLTLDSLHEDPGHQDERSWQGRC
jgi:hypothetical protein